MDKETLAQRLGITLKEVTRRFDFEIARLPNWKRVFDVPSERWHGGALNLKQDHRFKVGILGILISGLNPFYLSLLDKAEGRRYKRIKVKLFVKNEQREAWAYISQERDKEVVPSQNYINFLKSTLRELNEKLYQDFLAKTYDASGSRLFREEAFVFRLGKTEL